MRKSSEPKKLLEFEIAFYERLLQKHPDFVDALKALGEVYTRRGWYEKGLAVDLKLAQLKADDPIVWYNLACSYSLLRRPDDAVQALRQAIARGYDDFEYLGTDPDLQPLRQSPQFRRFLIHVASQRFRFAKFPQHF